MEAAPLGDSQVVPEAPGKEPAPGQPQPCPTGQRRPGCGHPPAPWGREPCQQPTWLLEELLLLVVVVVVVVVVAVVASSILSAAAAGSWGPIQTKGRRSGASI